MRVTWTTLLLVLLACGLALPAVAEEDTPAPAAEEPKPAPKPEPDPEVPVYSIEFLMPGEDDAPEGWKLRDRGAPDGSPTEDVLTAMSEACKCDLDEDNFYVETGVLKSGSEKVGFAMVDVDKSVWAFRQKVDEAAAKHGWKVVELGAKGRLLILGPGAKQAAAADALTEHIVYELGELGMNRIRGGGGHQEKGRKTARTYIAAIGTMVGEAGVANAVEGVVRWLEAQPTKRGEKADNAKLDAASDAFAKALAKGAAYPPRGSVLVWCAGKHGGWLLQKKDKALLPEAKRVLELAVEHEREAKQNTQRFENRYNLACAFAREKNVEKALELVKGALEVGKNMPQQWFRNQYKHIDEKDPDMAPLRQDPRFSEMMQKYKPAPAPDRRGHGKKKADEPKKDDGESEKDGE